MKITSPTTKPIPENMNDESTVLESSSSSVFELIMTPCEEGLVFSNFSSSNAWFELSSSISLDNSGIFSSEISPSSSFLNNSGTISSEIASLSSFSSDLKFRESSVFSISSTSDSSRGSSSTGFKIRPPSLISLEYASSAPYSLWIGMISSSSSRIKTISSSSASSWRGMITESSLAGAISPTESSSKSSESSSLLKTSEIDLVLLNLDGLTSSFNLEADSAASSKLSLLELDISIYL